MNTPVVTQTEIAKSRVGWLAEHYKMYMGSGGTEGHVIDLADIGGLPFTTCLLLRTKGRKSGEMRIAPLIYAHIGGEVVIVASKGGADVHPAWYVNITGGPEVAIQIATQAFKATWREPQGAERQAIWDFMVKCYPPYADYQKATKRQIPIVMLKTGEAIAKFTK